MSKITFFEPKTLTSKNLVANHKPFDDVVQIFDLEEKILKRTITLPTTAFRARLCLCTDTIVFIPGDEEFHIFPTLEVWSLLTMELKKKIDFGYSSLYDIYLSALGNFTMCSVEDDMFVYLLNLNTFEVTPLAMSRLTCANCIAISADEKFCAAATEENAFVWDIRGCLLQKTACSQLLTESIMFLPTNTEFLWNFVSGCGMMKFSEQKQTYSFQILLSSGYTDISRDAKYVVNLCHSEIIRVFEHSTMTIVRKILTDNNSVRPNVGFSENGRKIYYTNMSDVTHYSLLNCNNCYAKILVLLHKRVAPYVVLDILNLCISKKESSTFASESAFLLKDKLDAITTLMRLNE